METPTPPTLARPDGDAGAPNSVEKHSTTTPLNYTLDAPHILPTCQANNHGGRSWTNSAT